MSGTRRCAGCGGGTAPSLTCCSTSMWLAAVHFSTYWKQSGRLTAPRAKPMQESSMTNRISTPRAASYVMLALVPALLLVACGGNGDSATSSQSSPTSQAASDRPVTDSMHVDAEIGRAHV